MAEIGRAYTYADGFRMRRVELQNRKELVGKFRLAQTYELVGIVVEKKFQMFSPSQRQFRRSGL